MFIPASDEYSYSVMESVDKYIFADCGGSAYQALQHFKKQNTRVRFSNSDALTDFVNSAIENDELKEKYNQYMYSPFELFLFKHKGMWFSVKSKNDEITCFVLHNYDGTLHCVAYISLIRVDGKLKQAVLEPVELFAKGYEEIKQFRDAKYEKTDKRLIDGYNDAKTRNVFNKKSKANKDYLYSVICISMAYINLQIEQEREWKQMLREERAENTENITNNRQRKSIVKAGNTEPKKKGVIKIGELSITVPKGSKLTKTKIMKRYADVWGVRGHLRHYKNGKVVFIKPYKKGAKKDELEPINKEYLIM